MGPALSWGTLHRRCLTESLTYWNVLLLGTVRAEGRQQGWGQVSPSGPPGCRGDAAVARKQVRLGPHNCSSNSSAHRSLRCTPLPAIRYHMGHSAKTAHTLTSTLWERPTLGKEQAPGARAARVRVWLCHLLGVANGPAHMCGEPRRG